MWDFTFDPTQYDVNPGQAGLTIPAQPMAAPAAVPAQAPQGIIGGLLNSLSGVRRQPAQGFEGIPQREEPTWRDRVRTVLSPALMQIGAALMAPPAQRAAILGNLGSVVQAGQKTLADDRLYRAQLAAWQKANTQQARSPSDIELFLADPNAFAQYQQLKQKPQAEAKTYRAYTIGTDGRPNLIYEGKEQPTIHNIPREPDKPVRLIVPHDADISKLGELPPNVIPVFQPAPQKPQAEWHQATGLNEKGETVPGKRSSLTGIFIPDVVPGVVGKPQPGKKNRLQTPQVTIPGIPPEAGGTLQSGGVAPAPAGPATFPSSPLQGMSLQQLMDLRNKKLRGQ